MGKYQIEIINDSGFLESSADNVNSYGKIYIEEPHYEVQTKIGIKIFENEEMLYSAIIASVGGGTGVHKKSYIIESDRIVVCCSDSLFCLSIPDLSLIWKVQADKVACFEVFKYLDSYIVHGELEISRIDFDGEIMWQNGGADIFVTETGIDDFEINSLYIKATDWQNRIYKFDFNGDVIDS